jgi:hypothetical protein
MQQNMYLYFAQQQHSKVMAELGQLIEWALTNCSHDTLWKVDATTYPDTFHRAIKDQNQIGRSQIHYG